jgi:pyruvate/2-oxoglutarate dehydrogenase complex dihydrolipoamide dehydrogenase (E3) component
MTDPRTEIAPVEQTSSAAPDHVDLLVVGAGQGARRAAQAALRRGAQVLLVRPCAAATEPPPPIQFSTLWRLVRQPKTAGLEWAQMLHRARHETILASVPDSEPPPSLALADARFVGPDRLQFGDHVLRFRRALLVPEPAATPLESPGAGEIEYQTADSLESLSGVPATVAVVGHGAEACQWAQVLRQLGSQVHLVCPGGRLLPDEDQEIVQLLQTQLAADQVRLHLDTAPPTFERMGNRKAVLLGVGEQQRKLLVDEVLYFGPKRFMLDRLDLTAAGVTIDDGRIRTDAALRTANRRIFAVAPCDESTSSLERTLRIAVTNALAPLGGRWFLHKLRSELVPQCLYTEPEVVHLGLHSAAARPQQHAIYRAAVEVADGGPHGVRRPTVPQFLELVLERRTGRVAGATIVAQTAGRWLAPLTILMARRIPLQLLADMPACDLSHLEPLVQIARQAQANQPAWHRRLAKILPAGWLASRLPPDPP